MGVSDSGGRARVLGVTAAFSSGTCTGCGTDKAAPFLASPPHLQAGSYLPLLKTHPHLLASSPNWLALTSASILSEALGCRLPGSRKPSSDR